MSKKNKDGASRFNIKFNRVAFGLLLIACAVLIILDSVGVGLGFLNSVPAVTLIIGAILALWLLDRIVRLRISEIFFPLAFMFILFEKYIASWLSLKGNNIMSNWLVLLLALLLHIGFTLIIPKRQKHGFKTVYKGGVENGSKNNSHNASMGSSIIYIDCNTFVEERVKNEMGSCHVYFTNVDQYVGGGVLNLVNELGSLKVHVPTGWRIESSVTNEMGGFTEPSDKDVGEKSIVINGVNELGAISIDRD
jgi:hypothetical protein